MKLGPPFSALLAGMLALVSGGDGRRVAAARHLKLAVGTRFESIARRNLVARSEGLPFALTVQEADLAATLGNCPFSTFR